MTVAMFARALGVGSDTWGYAGGSMFASSVYFTPCWAGKYPDISVERAGEHMHAFVNAFSKVTPCRSSCVSPGRFCWDQPSGKCWMARSWSVMNMTTFIPARLAGGFAAARRRPPRGRRATGTPRWPPIAGGTAGGRCPPWYPGGSLYRLWTER